MSGVTPEQLNALLQFAAKRLGTTPEKLAQTVQNGGLEAVKDKMGADNVKKITDLAGNPAGVEQFLQSPEVRALLQKFGGGTSKNG